MKRKQLVLDARPILTLITKQLPEAMLQTLGLQLVVLERGGLTDRHEIPRERRKKQI